VAELQNQISGAVILRGGYTVAVVSGQVIASIVSGAVILHSIVIGSGASGCFAVWDSCSGAIGTIDSLVTNAIPQTLEYDVSMLSGIAVVTSGASWNLSVTYK
jgi:hypothetical protein